MTRVLVDTTVLVDLLTDDPEWSGWSSGAFCACRDPWIAAVLAGKAFDQYRRSGGERRSTLPDSSIGAHAAVAGMRLLMRDAARYRTCFPSVEPIAPDD